MSSERFSYSGRREGGVSLIELILFIVIVGVAIVGSLSVFNMATSKSGDPMLRKQALALAEATLDEALSKAYAARPGDTANTPNTPADRPNYNDVDDYNGWDQVGAYQQDGAVAPVIGTYATKITVAAPAELFDGVMAKKVTVTVNGGGEPITLVGYRTSYE